MRLTFVSAMFCLLTTPVIADELAQTQRFIDNLLANPPATALLDEAAEQGRRAHGITRADDDAWVSQLGRQATGDKPVPHALYFVSFSIPEEGLKRMILDADSFGIPSTLRGMVNNDMRDTANAVLRLVNEDKRGGVQIDPKAFTTYGINAVPALVVTCDGRYDRIAGNLALREALTKVAESGDCADTARAILAAHP